MIRQLRAPTLLAGLTAAGPALAQAAPPDQAWFWPYGWGMSGMMFGGGLVMLVFWAGIIVVAVLLLRWLGGIGPGEPRHQSRQTALEILQERYARGEIDKQEYEERRRTLITS
jgi:putative membrane protein